MLLVVLLVYTYSLGYIGDDYMRKKFYGVLAIFAGRIILLIFSGDLIRMFLAWEGLGIRSFLLVVYYNNHRRASSGIITIVRNRLGDVSFLLGLSLILGYGDLYFFCAEGWSCGFFFFACVAKRAQWPLCGWLPAAIAAPTPVSALVHSSTLVTAGGYLLLRFEGMEVDFINWVVVISVLTIFLARVGALVRFDLKRTVAMSTLCHMAFVVGAVLGGYGSLAIFHLLRHALFKSLLFLCAGIIIQEVGHRQDIRLIGNVMKSQPVIGMGLFYARVRIIGVPLLSGFYSKEAIRGGLMFFGVQGGEFVYVLVGLTLLARRGYAAHLLLVAGGGSGSSVVRYRNGRLVIIIPVVVLVSSRLLLGVYGCILGVTGYEALRFIRKPNSWMLLITGLVFGEYWLGQKSYRCIWYEPGQLGVVSSRVRSLVL